MKVSIITICYNAADTIEETIQSLIAQDYTDIEYLIIDGASTDESMGIIEKFHDHIDILVSEKDNGIYDAMNKGIARCSGELIGILNADDTYAHNQVISRIVESINLADSDTIYADLNYVSFDNPAKIVRHWRSGDFRPGLFLKGWMPPHPTFFVKRHLYDQFGSFNTNFQISADYELMLRMLYKHGVSTTYLPEVIVNMKTGGASNSSPKRRLIANKEDRLAWKINHLKPSRLTFIKKPLRKVGQFFN